MDTRSEVGGSMASLTAWKACEVGQGESQRMCRETLVGLDMGSKVLCSTALVGGGIASPAICVICKAGQGEP